MEFFPFQNNKKNLDPSCKDGSRSLGVFRKGKTHIIAKFHRTDLVICSHSREGKTPFYNQIYTGYILHSLKLQNHLHELHCFLGMITTQIVKSFLLSLFFFFFVGLYTVCGRV